jgi:hypothetical protein
MAPVLFAASSSDVADVRDAVYAELVDRGIAVCAPLVWSDEYTAMRDQLLDAVAGTRLVIQVVGATYGSRPEGADKSIPELQSNRQEK